MTDSELLTQARRRLDLFEEGALPLHQLVGDLRGIQDSLATRNESWLAAFDKERFALEEVNAVRLDEEYNGTDSLDGFVRTTVGKLRLLVDQYPG